MNDPSTSPPPPAECERPLATRVLGVFYGRTAKEFLGFLLLSVLATRLPLFLTDILNIDEGGWWMGAKVLLSGGVPFVDFIDNKPPGTYFLYAVPQLLGVESLWGVHVLSLLWAFLTALAVGEMAALLSGEEESGSPVGTAVGRAGALFFVLLSVAGSPRQFLPLNTENAGLLPFALALLHFVRARMREAPSSGSLFLSGFFLALAGLCRQVYLFISPLLALELLWPWREGERKIAQLMWIALGGAVPLVFFVLYCGATGSLEEARYWIFDANRSAVGLSVPFLFQARRFASNLLLPLLISLPAWVLLGGALSNPRTLPSIRARRLRVLFAGAAFLLLCAAGLGARWLGHYYLPCLVPLAALAAASFSPFARPEDPERKPRLALLAMIFSLIGGVSFPAWGTVAALRGGFPEQSEEIRRAAERVQSLTAPGEEIFIWGFAQDLYYLSRRLSASRFIAPNAPAMGYLFGVDKAFPGLDPRAQTDPAQFALLLDDLKKKPPALFLDYSEKGFRNFGRIDLRKFPEMVAFLENY
ncbi:MAG: hypothetical protein AB1405_13330, partial [Bdellovibrionota bacterium]